MALAVSFTNESYQAQACHALAMWIKTHPDYSALLPASLNPAGPENFKFTSSFMSSELHEETVDLFLRAARARATESGGVSLDPDVQVGKVQTICVLVMQYRGSTSNPQEIIFMEFV